MSQQPAARDDAVLHLRGPVLVGPDEAASQAWVLGGRITFTAPSVPASRVQALDGWVLPGLVDAHSHVGLGPDGEVPREEAVRQAEADRDAGTLLIRDAGQPGDTRWIDQRPDLPVIVRAGRHIARKRRYIRNYAHEIEPDQLAGYVRAEARRGDGWVKLVGDWIDRDCGDLAPCWPADALAEAVAAAHAEGARVTAHCFGEDCLPDLIAAGIDGIEHASGLTDDTRAAVAARGIAVVPTLVNVAKFPEFAAAGEAKFPRYAAHMRALHARRYETVAAAYESGVPLFAGTDAGGSLPHGLVAREVAELVTAGIPAAAALDAACWGARSWLGRPGLEEGAPADLVVYSGDPRADVRALADPRLIVLRGRIFR
ncbi:MAG TPA: amidohydrolase family protein [Kineosporiaceae bacterium]|nr:amidohydrolase family protein [Kineosporiaceae bacterium]